jgi:membrane associated rhomboid family serine protease
MGLADRPYMKTTPASTGSLLPGAGSPRTWSFNTWLIIVNIAVFIIAAGLQYQRVGVREVPVEVQWIDGLSSADQARALPLNNSAPIPGTNGLQQRSLGIPQTDPQGRLIVTPNGPLVREVGVQRFIIMDWLNAWGHFSTSQGFAGMEVWRFVTFQFLHAGLTHLALNMFGLWLFGGLVESILGARRYAAFYLVCGVFGAVMYLLLNLTGNILVHGLGMTALKVPFLLFDSPTTPLVGASAGIFGVIFAAAYLAPNDIVYILAAIPVKIRTLAIGLFVLAVGSLYLNTSNAGGEAAHIGGAVAGYFFIRRMHLLRDFFDVFSDSRVTGDQTTRTASAGRSLAQRLTAPLDGGPSPAELDRILTKIRATGLESLTPAERMALARDTEARRRAGAQSAPPPPPSPPSSPPSSPAGPSA